jgi:hypothetical protein
MGLDLIKITNFILFFLVMEYIYQGAVRTFCGCADGKAVFSLCAITVLVAAFPSYSGTAAK